MGSVDVNWLVWFRLLKLRQRPDWPVLWARLVAECTASLPSFAAADSGALNALTDILGGMSRSGSNSLAVAASKSASGGALIASDPHRGVSAPNIWLLVGYKSPSYHAVGMMIPGVPFIAVGRNPDIGWGGTNMRSAFGEHLIDAEIEAAVAQAARSIDADVSDYSVGPLYPEWTETLGGYLFIVEFAEAAVGAERIGAFAAALDAALAATNADYAAHRAGGYGLKPPRVEAVARGAFAACMKQRGKLGG